MITVSAPGKIHLLGEHTVVYGKPALLSAINLRVTVTIGRKTKENYSFLRKTANNLVRKKFKVKKIPDYSIESDLPVGCGLGFSAAGSGAIIAALLSHFKIKWNLNLINELTYEAEKIFHGNPSGGDNTTVVNGGLIMFQKGYKPTPLTSKIKSFVLIQSGKPVETTKQMINIAKEKINLILDSQESLTKQMVIALKNGKGLLEIIKKAEKNLEKIGVVGKIAKKIIKDIENLGGAAKISGAGGLNLGSGMLLCYHSNSKIILNYAKKNNLEAFIIKLGEEGLTIQQ